VNIREERTTSDNHVHPVVVTAVVGFLGWLVLAALAIGLGALVTHFVVGHSLGRGDLDVARWFAERRTDTWNSLSKVGSYFAETVTVFVIVAISLVVLAVKRAWPQAGLLVVAMAAEGGVYVTATYVISRNRPAVPRLEDLIVADSYPSGHTAAAMALYGSLCIIVWSLTRSQVWRGLFLALAVVGPLIVATSRVYRGMHNATDVICGLLIGAGCIVVGYVAVRAGLEAAHRRNVARNGEIGDADARSLRFAQEVSR
jgi:undecaprenyl-diphosphatase